MKTFYALFLLISFTISAQTIERTLPVVFEEFPHVRDFAMTQNQDELYFTVESYKKEFSFIAYVSKKNNVWSKPAIASFSGKSKDLEPFFSPDGLQLFFASNRNNAKGTAVKKDMDIWYVTRKSIRDPWSSPINVGSNVNTSGNEFYPSVTTQGDLFFTASFKDSKGKEDIYVSRKVAGIYQAPVSLSSKVNTANYEFNAYVAPDESFILFTSYGRKDDLGGGDLYISKKDKKGLWGKARHLGNGINSNKIDYCPFVDIHSKTLYFTSDRSTIPRSFEVSQTLPKLLNTLKNTPNGLGRVYQTDFQKILKNLYQ